MEITFDYILPVITYVLLGVALLGLLWIILFYVRRIRRVTRAVAADNEGVDPETDDETPLPEDAAQFKPASIVIYTQDQSSWLEELLPDILAQDYPAGFEVIVVNEGASDATRDIVENLAIAHPNLYLTYTPDGARNLSRKKLALTIGIKAAKNPVVVNVTAGVRVPSRHWLYYIMRNFNDPETEVVLGYAYPAPGDDSYGRRRRAFDYVADAVTWLSPAIAHRPFRGIEYNLAYTRDIFFRSKGFSRSLNLVNGDDDIFVNQITTRDNTAVELSYPSMLMANYRDHRAAQEDLLRRHYFTSRRLPRTSARLMSSGAWAIWIVLAAAIGAVVTVPTNVIVAAAAFVIVLATLLCVTLTWRNVMSALCSRRMFWTIPRLAMFRPLRCLTLAWRSRRSRNYTWN